MNITYFELIHTPTSQWVKCKDSLILFYNGVLNVKKCVELNSTSNFNQ